MRIGVGALIQKKDKFLLVKKAKGQLHENLWTFPGGKVEKEELIESALKREIKEEINLDISVGELLDATILEKEGFVILLFKCNILTGEIKLSEEIEEFIWLSLEELKKYSLRPGMEDLIKTLR